MTKEECHGCNNVINCERLYSGICNDYTFLSHCNEKFRYLQGRTKMYCFYFNVHGYADVFSGGTLVFLQHTVGTHSAADKKSYEL